MGVGDQYVSLTEILTFRPSSNLFATRCRKLSILQHTPSLNWFVFPAAGMALCIGIFFCYVPWL